VRSSLSDLGTPHEQWLNDARGTERDGKFILSVSDDTARAWIEARLTPAIQRALELSGRAELVLEVTR
jgi:chromosomal replication initiation ATPase DnaA